MLYYVSVYTTNQRLHNACGCLVKAIDICLNIYIILPYIHSGACRVRVNLALIGVGLGGACIYVVCCMICTCAVMVCHTCANHARTCVRLKCPIIRVL